MLLQGVFRIFDLRYFRDLCVNISILPKREPNVLKRSVASSINSKRDLLKSTTPQK